VLLFARARELAGVAQLELVFSSATDAVVDGSGAACVTLASVRARLIDDLPALRRQTLEAYATLLRRAHSDLHDVCRRALQALPDAPRGSIDGELRNRLAGILYESRNHP
jgi:hypothetical protein